MKCAEMIETEKAAVARQDAVRMPNGMLGFEEIKDYILTTNPEEQPFAWLQVQDRSEEHTSELQSLRHLVCRLLLEKKKKMYQRVYIYSTHDTTRDICVVTAAA